MNISPMTSYSRKLQLQPPHDMSSQLTNTTPPPSTSSSYPPLDSSVALTALLLLSVVFFMGFLSIYICRFCSAPPPSEITNHRPPSRAAAKGLDPEVIKSLPVYSSFQGEAKYEIEECAVCLGELEDEETVKIIPYCKHVFHLDCIDTWLKMHVTCPVCRGTQLFDIKNSGNAVTDRVEDGSQRDHGRPTVENDNTCTNLEDRMPSSL